MSERRTTPLSAAAGPAVPIYGLVLAGGASRRMQADKAELDYHGKPQLDWTVELLAPRCERVFVSLRRGSGRGLPAGVEAIVDDPRFEGPAAGIVTAMGRHPGVAWLVVACDLPFLDSPTLDRLVAARDPVRVATVYSSVNDSLPEPLCAIWEPGARSALEAFLDGGRSCPRKFLIDADVRLIEQPHPGALDNVNTRAERAAARRRLGGAGA